jgi:hypothetical protein
MEGRVFFEQKENTMADTELEAVNMCLRGIGIAAITIDEIATDLDAIEALEVVTQISHNTQIKGWWFNKEPDWNITPAGGTGIVTIPSGTSKITPSGESKNLNLTQRGTQMYDLDNHTYDLSTLVNGDDKITFTITVRLDYEDMPETARTSVAYIARRVFAQDSEIDELRWKFQKDDEVNATAAFELEHAQSKKSSGVVNDELDAINTCLRGIGLQPVTEFDLDTDIMANRAQAEIIQATYEIQMRSWWFNKEYEVNLTPHETTGVVTVPANTTKIVTSGLSRSHDLSLRDTTMYDLENNTDDLLELVNDDGDITFTVTTRLDFDDLPETVRKAVKYTARRVFAQNNKSNVDKWRFQAKDEMAAKVDMEREPAQVTKRNSITDNPAIKSLLSRVGGPNAY